MHISSTGKRDSGATFEEHSDRLDHLLTIDLNGVDDEQSEGETG